jgi:hypothetical protein
MRTSAQCLLLTGLAAYCAMAWAQPPEYPLTLIAPGQSSPSFPPTLAAVRTFTDAPI